MIWKNKKIHCVGIKGSGLSGLAILLKNEGVIISGSDTEEQFPSEKELNECGIEMKKFSEKNISGDLDLVIYSSAWKDGEEMDKTRELKISELSYAEALGEYAKGRKTIVVTGTHGKTTTTAILGQIFEAAGLDPSVLSGDIVKAWGSSVRYGKGEYFIVEGDEYQEKFKYFSPVGIIIPSLDYDHPDYFKDKESYQKAFADWIRANPMAVLVTDPEDIDKKIFSRARFIFPGAHYMRNTLLAIHLSRIFGIGEASIIEGINNFKGVSRRLEYYSPENGDVVIVYDYAHHPVEIKATLAALKERYPDYLIIAVFQPHTYSRTRVFLEDFAKSFGDADQVFFDEIYASAREKSEDIKIEDLISSSKKHHQKVFSFSEFSVKNYSGKVVFIFMGAGDIWGAAEELSKSLLKR